MASSNMDPPLCANGCGFFGYAASQNLCSKCYEDLILREKIERSAKALNLKQAEKIEISPESFIAKPSSSSACDNENAAAAAVTASEEKTKKKKNRCKNCNKKVGLTGFPCRCGEVFCGKHRYPEEHACKVNLQEIDRQILAKQNPICKADKLESRV